jgi:hypothetical protein
VTDTYEIILERRARKNLGALDPPVRRRVALCIDELASSCSSSMSATAARYTDKF